MTQAIRNRIAAVDRRLETAYGRPKRRRGDALGTLIATILSQNTNDKNSAMAYSALRRAFPTWAAVMNAQLGDLGNAIRSGGLAGTKARRIQQILRSIAARGRLSLSHLDRLTPDEAEQELLRFKGVGPKTARCVLLFACGMDVFPIATHIERVLKRLGVLDPRMTPARAHAWLPPFIPAGRCHPLHINLITHGRRVCHARNPNCGACVLSTMCPYYPRTRSRDKGR
jgi:endonuclease-3